MLKTTVRRGGVNKRDHSQLADFFQTLKFRGINQAFYPRRHWNIDLTRDPNQIRSTVETSNFWNIKQRAHATASQVCQEVNRGQYDLTTKSGQYRAQTAN